MKSYVSEHGAEVGHERREGWGEHELQVDGGGDRGREG